MSRKLLHVLPHALMLVASVLLYWAATKIRADTGGGTRIGPDVWPKAIIAFMALLCAWEIVKRLLLRPGGEAKGPAGRRPDEAAGGEEPGEAAEHPRKLAWGVALVFGYVVTAPWVGFFVATAVFLAAFPWFGGLRRPILAAVLGVAGSFLLVVAFMRVAYISLPLGEGPFLALSLALLRLIGVS